MALFFILTPTAQAAGVRAWLDRGSMQMGETVTLNVEVESAVTGEPDFSVLGQDFRLLGTQSSRAMNFINGVSSSKTLWAIGLEPLHDGTITIPALSVGSERTEPLSLTVLPATAAATTPGDAEAYVEMTAEPRDPYVQQQVQLTVKLFVATTLTEGQLSEPAANGFAIERLGQDRNYFADVGGRRYQVIERRYALTPERSGPLTIAPLQFAGRALDGGGFFGRGRQLRASTTPIELSVKPRPPESGAGPWLPARALELSEAYGSEPLVARVGEPLTRTVTLRAEGLGQAQLPDPAMAAPEGAQIYPDQPETGNRHGEHWVVGERRVRYAIVPKQAGKLLLPEIRLAWWDLVNDRPAHAILAAREIDVLPAEVSASVAPSVAPTSAQPAIAPTATSLPIDAVAAWWRVLAMALGLAWLLTIGAWLRSRNLGAVATQPSDRLDVQSLRAAQAEFVRACASGDARAMARKLLNWARLDRPTLRCRNLVELGQGLDDPAQRSALQALDRALYGAASSAAESTQIAAAFRDGLRWTVDRSAVPQDGALPPLWNI